MKLFKTNNLETVTYCRTQFNFDLPSTVITHRAANDYTQVAKKRKDHKDMLHKS